MVEESTAVILARIDERLVRIEEQTIKTNGRVTTIENWKNALIAVDQYKKEQQPTVHTEQGNVIVQAAAARMDAQTKLILAVAGLASIAATVLGVIAGVSK